MWLIHFLSSVCFVLKLISMAHYPHLSNIFVAVLIHLIWQLFYFAFFFNRTVIRVSGYYDYIYTIRYYHLLRLCIIHFNIQ